MTEAEWLKSSQLAPMLAFLRDRGHDSRRKLRLLGCAVVRTCEHLLTERSLMGIVVAERWADGLATQAGLAAAHKNAKAAGIADAVPVYSEHDCYYWARSIPNLVVSLTERQVEVGELAEQVCNARDGEVYYGGRRQDSREAVGAALKKQHADFLRDIFGNPFRPVPADSAWLAPAVVRLAQAIYEDRAFNQLPKLAAALQVVGCSNADLIAHCRTRGPHVRGCWVVDLLLGKN